MESRLHYQRRTIRTHGHVLWNDQFPSHLPSYDERHIRRRNPRRVANGIHGRHAHRNRRRSNPPYKICPQDTEQTREARPVSQAGEVRLHPTSNRIPRRHPRRQHDPNGPYENQRSSRMATTKEPYRRPLIPRVHRILSLLHPQLFESSAPPTGSNQKGDSLGVDNDPDDSI